MHFDALVDRLQSLHDVGVPRASDVANERLARMLGGAKSLRSRVTVGLTVAAQNGYACPEKVVQVYRVVVAYTSGTVVYAGTESRDALEDLKLGLAVVRGCDGGHFYAFDADSDSSMNTENLYLHPAPQEAGKSIVGLCAILPETVVYGSAAALPIPLDCHSHLLAGCRADLLDEESRQDESAKLEAVFEAGVRRLVARQASRGQGSDRHRMRYSGYDLRR